MQSLVKKKKNCHVTKYVMNSKAVSMRVSRHMSKWPKYFSLYDRHFSSFVGKRVNVWEIGVCGGGSLQMWKKFFGPRATIVGIDIEPNFYFEEDQIHVHIGSQSDTEFLSGLVNKYGPPDVLIDDGSHTQTDLHVTFKFLYPLMKRKSVYFIEDTHTAYWKEYGGRLLQDGTIVESSKRLIDELTGRHFCGITDFTLTTKGIHFYDSVIVFEKEYDREGLLQL